MTSPHQPDEHHTHDTLFNGALTIQQGRRGYRFSIDAVILGMSFDCTTIETLLDAGCGSGVVGLACLHAHPHMNAVGIDVQPSLLHNAQRSASLSKLDHRYTTLLGDLRTTTPPENTPQPDLILLNPPYFPPHTGRINPQGERAAARHLLHGDLTALLQGCTPWMHRTSTLRMIHPAASLPELFQSIARTSLKPVRLRPIHSFPNAPARLLLLDLKRTGRRELELLPALSIYSQPNTYSPPIQAMLQGSPLNL